ncbi:hypothetical protein V6Z11_D10G025500 [Gossypium hirsutum]
MPPSGSDSGRSTQVKIEDAARAGEVLGCGAKISLETLGFLTIVLGIWATYN